MAADSILRLWAARARMDVAVVARSPRLVALWFVTDVLGYAAGVTTPLIISARFQGIGRWTTAQMLILLGYGTCAGAWRNMLFGYNLTVISRRIGRGQLDHTLVQPRPVWMTLATEGFAPVSSGGPVVFGTALLAYGATRAYIPAGWTLVNLVATIAVAMSFQYAWGCVAFWAPYGAEELNSRTSSLLLGATQLPLDGTRGLLRGLVVSIVPVGFMSWVPARALVGHAPGQLWVTPAVAVVFVSIATLIFRKGLRHYAITGSRRYSDFGHRR